MAGALNDIPLLQVEALRKDYRGQGGRRGPAGLRAVDDVSFDLGRGESLGLVGESGSGKSTLAKMLVGLEKPSAGVIRFEGKDIAALSHRERHQLRRRIQLISQDPRGSLDPRQTIEQIVAEGWTIHPIVPRNERRERVLELLQDVGLSPEMATRYPHQLSGGQQQRVCIARALAVEPDVIICDEPVSALDVSVQAQVINLLQDLQTERGIAYVFISHDLSVVQHIADRVAVMYLGNIVEVASSEEIFEGATHPYTQALLSAMLDFESVGAGRPRILLKGDLPDPGMIHAGCPFRSRCWKPQEICRVQVPQLSDGLSAGHPSACFFAEVLEVLET